MQYGKRHFATIVVGGANYICAVAVITNATCVGKYHKIVYNKIGYVIETVKDASHIFFYLYI